VSNRADLIIGLLISVLIILGLGVYRVATEEGGGRAAPSITPTADEVTGPVTPAETRPPASPGEPSPETASPERSPLTQSPSPTVGAQATATATAASPSPTRAPQTQSPAASPSPTRGAAAAASPTPSPTAAAAAAGVAQTGAPAVWWIGVALIIASGVLIRALRRTA
jgi:hypothetical protein